jgi:predicted nucleic acid-binding protein
MKGVLVDTSIWSEVLRRKDKRDNDYENQLVQLIKLKLIRIIGPIRQELLSGLKTKDQYYQLKAKLKVFIDEPILTEDYESAAEMFNVCRSHGIQGSFIDFLICAISIRKHWVIFTNDKDFKHYGEWVPIKTCSSLSELSSLNTD